MTQTKFVAFKGDIQW